MNRLEELKARIASREAHIGVIGLGYVGLPLGARVHAAGHGVTGFDVDQRARRVAVRRATSYIEDVPSEAVAKAVADGKFTATTDFGRLSVLRRDQRLRAHAAHQGQGPRRLAHGGARSRRSASGCARASS